MLRCATDHALPLAARRLTMSLLPKHRLSRFAATLWLLVCAVFLILTLLKHDLYSDERSALTHLVPVYFLSFPAGHIAVVAISKIKLALYLDVNFEPSILSECVFSWIFSVILGYLQWFILLPWVSRQCWRLFNALFNRENVSARRDQARPE